MKIALVGATGNVGTRLISELTRRGHHVTAIARHPEKPPSARFQGCKTRNHLATVLAGHDAVIHSVKFLSTNASKIIAAHRSPVSNPEDKRGPQVISFSNRLNQSCAFTGTGR